MLCPEPRVLFPLRRLGALGVLCLTFIGLVLLLQRPVVAQVHTENLSHLNPVNIRPAESPAAEVVVTDLSLYVDSTGRLEIDEVSRQVFTPFKLFLNRSLEPTTRWLKIEIQALAGQSSPKLLSVGPYFLSELELYYQDKGQWIAQRGGAKSPSRQLKCSIGHHCFALPNAEAGQSTYFLRIKTLNGFYVSTRVFSANALIDETTSSSVVFGVQIGALLLLIGWSAIYFMRFRSLLIGLFCLTQTAVLFFYCFSSGAILREFVAAEPERYAQILNSAICLRLLLSTCVCYEMLRRWQTHAWFRYYFLFSFLFWLVQLLMAIFGQIKLYMLLLNWVFLFLAPILISMAIYQSQNLARLIKVSWTAGMLTVVLFMFTDAFSLMTDSDVSIMTILPSSAVSVAAALAIYLLLLGYTKAQQDQWLQTIFDFNALKAQNDYEQRQMKERSTLIDMLSHELKNPLATMRIALGSVKSIFGKPEYETEFNERFSSINQSIDNMTKVIDRVSQVDAIDQKNFVVQYEQCAVLEVLKNLPLVIAHSDRFKILASRQLSIHTDRLLFITIVNNLIDNAIKYSPPTSTIEVSVSVIEGDKLLCTVSNEVERDHAPDPAALFTRYYRSVYSHDKPGSGLGLVLIKSLCEILKGNVTYRCVYNRVFFVVELPL